MSTLTTKVERWKGGEVTAVRLRVGYPSSSPHVFTRKKARLRTRKEREEATQIKEEKKREKKREKEKEKGNVSESNGKP